MLDLFPLESMGTTFAGTHSITLKDGRVCLNIWWKGKSWTAKLDDEEESRLNGSDDYINELITGVKAEIERTSESM